MVRVKLNADFGNEEAREFVNKVTYVRDARTDLCFAIVASRKTGSFSPTGLGITEVPCENVVEYLK